MTNDKINITELDFDRIKESLRQYLRGQDQFTDYNFQGSALSVLLDILAYNTHYNAYYANMAINESFLDSAVKRASVVSRAKTLGYTPRSARAATAIVDIYVTPNDDPEYIVLQKGTQILTSSQGTQYSFNVMSTTQTFKVDGVYKFENVVLKEGKILSYSYPVDKANNPNLVFEIPSEDVDTSLLSVRVQNSLTDTTTRVFQFADSIANIGAESEVYWVQENFSGRYEIYFGDGLLGKTLNDGNIVYLEYVKSNKTLPNGARYFTAGQTIGGYSNVNVVTKLEATGGAEQEEIDSIRFYAPKAYAAQQRLVVADDYVVHIQKNFPELEKVVVWGGETNTPPVYGKVFICAKPIGNESVTDALKSTIIDDIKKFNVISVTPEFVEPDITHVGVKLSVKVNRKNLTKTVDQIKAIATNGIASYFETIGSFGESFMMSRFTRYIDDLDSSFVGSTANIQLMKTHSPLLGSFSPIDLSLNNSVTPKSLSTTAFNVRISGSTVLGIFEDDGEGKINLKDYQTGNILISNIGSIAYQTGILKTGSFLFEATPYNDGEIFFYYTPNEQDIRTKRNQLLSLDTNSALFAINRKQGVAEVSVEFTDD